MANSKQLEIARFLDDNSVPDDWHDWRWHLRNSITDIDTFTNLTGCQFSDEQRLTLEKTLERFPLSITPYYASLIDKDNPFSDPVFLQAFPRSMELDIKEHDMADPLAEDHDSPCPGITHRYPDRVLFHVANTCAMYCRHCTRKRKVGDEDSIPGKDQVLQGIAYIKAHPEVRDVLLSGGDPLMMDDEYLDWILSEVRSIEHVEVIRIGSRMPVVLPQRITENLVNVLKKHHPVWLNTHFNHPREITKSSRKALACLADAGIPLGNQSVLLRHVNDCPFIMKNLVHQLVKNRVRPYYLYQCDLSEGLSHFRTPVGKGIEIIESLIGHTSGFAVPTYVIDAPGGGGKIPVMPNYLISWSSNKVVLRNFEGVITSYREPEYKHDEICDNECDNCRLQIDVSPADDELACVGIHKLLSEWNDTTSLVPENNQRHDRRGDD